MFRKGKWGFRTMRLFAIISFISSIVIGYGTEWSAKYVELFSDQNTLTLGPTNKFAIECHDKSQHSFCSAKYRIHLPKDEQSWIGVGSIISATRFKCQNGQIPTSYDDYLNPGQRFDLMTVYQKSFIPMGCGEYIDIEAWSRNGAIRKGHVGGQTVIGNHGFVNANGALYEFFSIELIRMLTYVFIFVALVQVFTENIYSTKIKLSPLSSLVPLWIIFLLLASNIGQTILPIQNKPLIFNKLVSLLSGLAHCGPLLVHLIQTSKDIHKKTISYLIVLACLVYGLLSFSAYFSTAFISTFFVSAVLATYLSIKSRNLALLLYSFTLAAVGLKVLNFSYLPSAMTCTVYVGVFLSLESLRHIKKLSLLLGRVTKATENPALSNSSPLEFAEKELLQILETKQLTFVYVLPGSKCEIRIYKFHNNQVHFESMLKEELPPVFAHAFSKREAIWHASPLEQRVKSVKSKSTRKDLYEEKYFCVVPLIDNNQCHGGFSFTTNARVSNSESSEAFSQRIIAELSAPHMLQKLVQHKMAKESTSYKDLTLLQENVHEITSSSLTEEQIMQSILNIINQTVTSQGFIAKLNNETRQLGIKAINYKNDEIQRRYLSGKVFAHVENEQGPLAVSVNHKKIVIVQDVKLYSGVLHEFTNYFFKLSGTNSCASIPIFNPKSEKSELSIWGVLFLEAVGEHKFDMSQDVFFSKLGEILNAAISSIHERNILKKTEQALETFIPTELVSTYLENSQISKNEEGILMMLDLKSSTKISNSYSKKHWQNSVEAYAKNEIIAIGTELGFEFKNFTWDAFYFTLAAEKPSRENVLKCFTFLRRCKDILDSFYSTCFGDQFHEFKNPATPKARLCFSYGDISMGIIESGKRHWGITGQEMANLTKLESIAKSHQKTNPYSTIYTDSSIINSNDDFFTKTGLIVAESSREIFSGNSSWQDLDINTSPAKISNKKTA